MRKVLVPLLISLIIAFSSLAQDDFEDDDTTPLASLLAVDAPPETHTFHDTGDVDRAIFYAEAGTTKTVRTQDLGANCDTFLTLVRPNGSTLENDNADGGTLASEISFIVEQTGLYEAVVVHTDPDTFGAGTGYELEVIEEGGPVVNGRIAGIVRDAETQQILVGATVTLLNFGGLIRISGANGAYEFLNLRTNRYVVEARAQGYESLIQTVTLPSASRFVTLGFELTPLPPPPVLTITPSSRNVDATAGSTTFAISNIGEGTLEWSAQVVAGGAWLSVRAPGSGTDDGTLTADFLTNPTSTARAGTIRVTAAGAEGSPTDLTVTQAAAGIPILEVTPASREVSAQLGTTTFTVNNGGNGAFAWTAEVIGGTAWLQISSGASGGDGDTIELAVAANPDPASRTGQVRVTAPGAEQSPVTVSVTQLGNNTPEIDPDPAVIDTTSAAGTGSITVDNAGNGDLEWTAAVTNGQDWLRITAGVSGSDGDTIALAWDESRVPTPRTGVVTLTALGASNSPVAVEVRQAADATPELAVDLDSITVAAPAAEATLNITNSRNGTLNWTAAVTSGADWLSISAGASGGDGDSITLAIAANAGNSERSGTIEIVDPNASNSPLTLTVTQAGQQTPILSVTPEAAEAPPLGGGFTITIENTGGGAMLWNAAVTSGGDWLSLTPPAGGTNDGAVECVATANAGVAVREAEVTITATGALGSPFVVPVTQRGQLTPELAVAPLEVDLGPDGGVTEFAVSNAGGGSLNWSAVVANGANWLAITSGAAGTGPGTIRVSAAPNNTASARTGRVQVRALGALNAPLDLSLRQQASCRPAAPGGLIASDASRSDGIFVQWNPVAGAEVYRLYRSSTPELADALLVASLFETQYLDVDAPGPQAGGGCGSPPLPVVQYYWVAAENACGEGPFSRGEIGSRAEGSKAAGGGVVVLGVCVALLLARRRN